MPQSPPLGKKLEDSPKRLGMVDWYGPGQLTKTGAQTLISTLLGAMIDTRRVLAADGEMADCLFDYSDEQSFSFDYLADTGDGFDSTYTMAYLATCDALNVGGEELERPDLVILGGDEVYPVASKREYYLRLQLPFKLAADAARAAKRAATGKERAGLSRTDLYMIPGNHDWYDGLGSMSRRFFSYLQEGHRNKFGRPRKERRLGQFLTHQARSYFALKLPHNWHIWGVDIQLGEDIDPQQYAFFCWCSQALTPESKVILCSAVPTIVYGREHAASSLTFGLDRIGNLVWGKGARNCAQFAGDIHNYQHYINPETKKTKSGQQYERHHVVCGGGGAFLHPNHSFNKGSAEEPRVEPLARFPTREQSKKLSWRIPLFPFKHVGMCVFIGVLYLLMFWTEGPPQALAELGRYFIDHPLALILGGGAVAGCALFAGGRHWWFGALHGIGHVALAVLSWRWGGDLTAWLSGVLPWIADAGLAPVVQRVATLVLGGLLGGTLFGLYLMAGLNLFRLHHNEAFSSLGWPHHKSMLRCTVEADGSLTVRALGIEKTAGEDGQHPVPVELVEKFTIT